MTRKTKYFISTPESVRNIAEAFEAKLKNERRGRLSGKQLLKGLKTDEKCDIVLVFFPIVSRTGTDIETTLSKLTAFGDKPAILVALHHTFDPESVVLDSGKFVTRVNTCTVDCLFHEDQGLLKCQRNTQAIEKAAKWLKSQKKAQKERKGQGGP